MRADRKPKFCGGPHGSSHDTRIAGMQTACDVGGTDVRQYRRFAQRAFVAIVLTEITVEIDRSAH
jgi:hypothetical protein